LEVIDLAHVKISNTARKKSNTKRGGGGDLWGEGFNSVLDATLS